MLKHTGLYRLFYLSEFDTDSFRANVVLIEDLKRWFPIDLNYSETLFVNKLLGIGVAEVFTISAPEQSHERYSRVNKHGYVNFHIIHELCSEESQRRNNSLCIELSLDSVNNCFGGSVYAANSRYSNFQPYLYKDIKPNEAMTSVVRGGVYGAGEIPRDRNEYDVPKDHVTKLMKSAAAREKSKMMSKRDTRSLFADIDETLLII